jgi:hypothetical protein
MEGVLAVYERPADPRRPRVGLDEKSKPLIADARPAAPMRPGRPRREDYEYERRGTRNLFVAFDPDRRWRKVEVTRRRTKADFARFLKSLVDEAYPEAERIDVVLDNLNTHFAGSLHATFEEAEAERLLGKLEFHHTPVHASWLNMAEIEIGVLDRQCLDRRIGDEETLTSEVAAWEAERNRQARGIAWTFTRAKARQKFDRAYASNPP